MQRQGLLTEKQAVDIRGGIRRFFKENPYENLSYEELKNIPPFIIGKGHPDEHAFYNKILTRHLKSDPSRRSDFHKHVDDVDIRQLSAEIAVIKRNTEALKQRNLEAQQAAQTAHVNQATNRMHNLGQDALIASGGVGLGLYGGKKLYDTMKKQSSAEIAEKVAVVVGGQRLQAAKDFFTASFNSLDRYLAGHHTPEELKAFYVKVRKEAEATGAKTHPELQPLYESLLGKFKQARDFVTANPVPIKSPKPPKPTPTAKQPKQSKQPNKPSKSSGSSSSSSSSSDSSSPKWPLRTAIGILGAGGLTGAGMLGHHLYKEHEANKMLKESEEQPQLTEEQIQMLRLSALTPEQRALYLQVNPAGVPKMATSNTNIKEALFRDFFRGPIGRKSPEFVQGRQAIDIAGKAKREEDYLKSYAKSKGLNVNPTGEIGHAPQPGFFSRNKLPLGLLAAGAGGLYLMNQQDKTSAYNDTLSQLGLGKLAAKLPSVPPPIPFKAKSQAARQGKPFFTPSQAERAKKLEGPAPAKAPWEDLKTASTQAFNQGYMDTLAQYKVAGAFARMLKNAPIHEGAAPSRYATGFGVKAEKAVAKPSTMDQAKGVAGHAAKKTQEAWGKMPTWGKGMAAGGAGLGLLGGGMGLGSAMASPPPQPPVVIAR